MKLICKLLLLLLLGASLSACSNSAAPTPPKNNVDTVKIVDQSVKLKKPHQPAKPMNGTLPSSPLLHNLNKKKTIYTDLNKVLKRK